MKVKTCDLIGPSLDWAVATLEGLPIRHDPMGFGKQSPGGYWIWPDGFPPKPPGYMQIGKAYSPSTNWAQGGLILDQHIGNLWKHTKLDPQEPDVWTAAAYLKAQDGTMIYYEDGPTALIAAMRCYVASEYGAEVSIP